MNDSDQASISRLVLSEKTKHVYHFEYTSIHNNRIALVKLLHLWHQIGIPASIGVFGFFLQLGLSKENVEITWIGFAFASLILFVVRLFAWHRGHEVARLYPRIVCLELLLDYQFFRQYLRDRGDKSPEKAFVEACESIELTSENSNLWQEVLKRFDPRGAWAYKRYHRQLDLIAILITITYVSTLIIIFH